MTTFKLFAVVTFLASVTGCSSSFENAPYAAMPHTNTSTMSAREGGRATPDFKVSPAEPRRAALGGGGGGVSFTSSRGLGVGPRY